MIDTIEEYVGAVTELVGNRRARMLDMVSDGRGHVRLEFSIPTRGLIGLRNAFLTGTRGNGTMASRLTGYEPWQGEISSNRSGALVASESGTALTHGISNAQVRGVTFIAPGTQVYEGMIVGQQPRQEVDRAPGDDRNAGGARPQGRQHLHLPLDRPALGQPFPQAAVQHRDPRVAEGPEHPPHPAGAGHRRGVVDHDLAAVTLGRRGCTGRHPWI